MRCRKCCFEWVIEICCIKCFACSCTSEQKYMRVHLPDHHPCSVLSPAASLTHNYAAFLSVVFKSKRVHSLRQSIIRYRSSFETGGGADWKSHQWNMACPRKVTVNPYKVSLSDHLYHKMKHLYVDRSGLSSETTTPSAGCKWSLNSLSMNNWSDSYSVTFTITRSRLSSTSIGDMRPMALRTTKIKTPNVAGMLSLTARDGPTLYVGVSPNLYLSVSAYVCKPHVPYKHCYICSAYCLTINNLFTVNREWLWCRV